MTNDHEAYQAMNTWLRHKGLKYRPPELIHNLIRLFRSLEGHQ